MRPIGILLVLIFLVGGFQAPSATAVTITVDTTEDEVTDDGNCALREAVQAANTNVVVDACPAGSDTATDEIVIPTGTYTLTGTPNEDFGESGDLDVLANTAALELIVTGAGPDATILQACTASQKTTLCSGGQGTQDRLFNLRPRRRRSAISRCDTAPAPSAPPSTAPACPPVHSSSRTASSTTTTPAATAARFGASPTSPSSTARFATTAAPRAAAARSSPRARTSTSPAARSSATAARRRRALPFADAARHQQHVQRQQLRHERRRDPLDRHRRARQHHDHRQHGVDLAGRERRRLLPLRRRRRRRDRPELDHRRQRRPARDRQIARLLRRRRLRGLQRGRHRAAKLLRPLERPRQRSGRHRGGAARRRLQPARRQRRTDAHARAASRQPRGRRRQPGLAGRCPAVVSGDGPTRHRAPAGARLRQRRRRDHGRAAGPRPRRDPADHGRHRIGHGGPPRHRFPGRHDREAHAARCADIAGSAASVAGTGALLTTFDLAGAAPGAWSVVVTNPDTSTATLVDGFTVDRGRRPGPLDRPARPPGVPIGRLTTDLHHVREPRHRRRVRRPALALVPARVPLLRSGSSCPAAGCSRPARDRLEPRRHLDALVGRTEPALAPVPRSRGAGGIDRRARAPAPTAEHLSARPVPHRVRHRRSPLQPRSFGRPSPRSSPPTRRRARSPCSTLPRSQPTLRSPRTSPTSSRRSSPPRLATWRDRDRPSARAQPDASPDRRVAVRRRRRRQQLRDRDRVGRSAVADRWRRCDSGSTPRSSAPPPTPA